MAGNGTTTSATKQVSTPPENQHQSWHEMLIVQFGRPNLLLIERTSFYVSKKDWQSMRLFSFGREWSSLKHRYAGRDIDITISNINGMVS
jgi:hypothetical protein